MNLLALIAFIVAAALSCTRHARWWPLALAVGLAFFVLGHGVGLDLD